MTYIARIPAVVARLSAGLSLFMTLTAHPQGITVFRGVTIIDGTRREPARNAVIVIEDGMIRAVGPAAMTQTPADASIVDAAGKFLIPGLADMHVHLEYFDDPAVLGLFLANGVTTVRNMDGRPFILEWKRRIEAAELLGPTIYSAGPLLDGDPPLRPDNMSIAGVAEAERAVADQLAAGYDFIKVYSNLAAEPYRAVLAEARRLGLPVTGHVPRGLELTDVLESGQAAIEHLSDYAGVIESRDSPFRSGWHWSKLFLGMPTDAARVRSIAERQSASGVWTVPTIVQADRGLADEDTLREWLASDELRYVEADAREFWADSVRRSARRMDDADWALVEEGRRNRLELTRALHEAGARLLAGTDTPNPFVVPGFALHAELANFVDAGLTPSEALAVATSAAAAFLGDLDEWGTIEPSQRADLVLLGADPTEDIGNVQDIVGVMVRGRWLSRDDIDVLLDGLRQP